MKIIRFTKSTHVGDRFFARGDHREFDDETAAQLIADGLATDPNAPKVEAAPKAEKPAATKKAGRK